MTNEEIALASDAEINNTYLERLYKFREDIKSIRARLKKKKKILSANQELIASMISTSKNSAILNINGIRIQFSTGCKKHGLKHILLRHFCEGCEGEVSAMDIISLERFLQQNDRFTSSDNSKYGYNYKKDENNKYRLLLFKDVNADGVLTVYKLDRVK